MQRDRRAYDGCADKADRHTHAEFAVYLRSKIEREGTEEMVNKIDLARPEDVDWISAALTNSWGSHLIVINGRSIDASKEKCLVATPQLGLLVFRNLPDNGVEIIAIEVFSSGNGIGRKLLDFLIKDSERRGKSYLSATTTNDNLAAIRFYQQYGFQLFELRVAAVEQARERLKPEIPETGNDDIPIRDEIELRYTL